MNDFKANDWTNYSKTAISYFDKFGSKDSLIVNEISWTLFEKSDNSDALKKAEKIMAEVITKVPEFATLDTYAAILYKNGNNKDAIKYAEKAIEYAKKSNQDYSATLELLEKMKK